jgi:hypothetical protein
MPTNVSSRVVNMSCRSFKSRECAMVPPILSLLCGCVPYSFGTTPTARRRETR